MPEARRRPAPGRPSTALVVVLGLAMIGVPRTTRAQAPPNNAACMRAYEAAQRTRLAKKLKASHENLLICAKDACPQVLRQDCAKWLGEVETAMPSVVVSVRTGGHDVTDFELRIDDYVVSHDSEGLAIDVDPGEHVFRVDAGEGQSLEKKLVILEGDKNRRVSFELEPKPASRTSRNLVPAYGLAALGVIGVGSFVFFGLRAHSKKQDLEACKGHCPSEDVNAVRRDQIVGDVSLGVGLCALGAAAYFYFGHSSASTGWALGARPVAHGGTVSLSAAF